MAWGRKGPTWIWQALRFHIEKVLLECSLWFTTSAETFARDGFNERAQNGQRVSVRSPVGAPDNRGVGNVLAEKRGEVRAIVSKFGLKPVRPSLLGVRRANRGVEGGVRIAEGRGEDVSGPEIGARDEAKNLCLDSAVAGLSRGLHKCSDRVVAAGGLAQGTAGGVGGACVQGSRLAGTRHRFTGPGAAQAQANRINVLFRLQDGRVVRVQAHIQV